MLKLAHHRSGDRIHIELAVLSAKILVTLEASALSVKISDVDLLRRDSATHFASPSLGLWFQTHAPSIWANTTKRQSALS